MDETKVKEYITKKENQDAVISKALAWSEKGISGTFFLV